MKNLLISSSDVVLYRDISVFNVERQKTPKKIKEKKKKIARLEVKPFNAHQL